MTFGLVIAGHVMVDFYANVLPPIIPAISRELGLSFTMAGSLISAVSMGSYMSQPFFGVLADRYGQALYLPVSLAWIAVLMTASVLARAYWPLLTLVVLAGLGSGGYHPLGAVAARQLGPRASLSVAMYTSFGSFGYALAPLAVTAVAGHFGLPAVTALAFPGLLMAALLMLAGWRGFEYPRKGEAITARTVAAAGGKLWLLVSVASLRFFVGQSLIMFIPMFYTMAGKTDEYAGSLLTLYLMACVLGAVFGGYFSDRHPERRKAMIVASLLLNFLLLNLYAGPNRAASAALVLLAGALSESIQPVLVVTGQEMAPNHMGMASGMMIGMALGVGGLGTILTGLLADHAGLLAALRYSTLALPLAALLASRLPAGTPEARPDA